MNPLAFLFSFSLTLSFLISGCSGRPAFVPNGSISFVDPNFFSIEGGGRAQKMGEEVVLYRKSESFLKIKITEPAHYEISTLLKGTICQGKGPLYEIKFNDELVQTGNAAILGTTVKIRRDLISSEYLLTVTYPKDCFVSQFEDGNLVISEVSIEKIQEHIE